MRSATYILTAPCSWIELAASGPSLFHLRRVPRTTTPGCQVVSRVVCVYSALGRGVWGALIATKGHMGRVASRAGDCWSACSPPCCSASLPLVSPLFCWTTPRFHTPLTTPPSTYFLHVAQVPPDWSRRPPSPSFSSRTALHCDRRTQKQKPERSSLLRSSFFLPCPAKRSKPS